MMEELARAQRSGDWRTMERLANEAIASCETAQAHYYLGMSYFLRNDGTNAKRAFRRSLELGEAADDRLAMLRAKIGLASVAGDIDLDSPAFRHLCEEALVMARDVGDDKSLAVTLGNLAEACHQEGEHAAALRYAGEAAQVFLRLERWSSAGAQYATTAHVYLQQRELPAAIGAMGEAWEYLRREDVPFHRAWYFQVWFLIAAALGEWESAAWIYGFVNHYRDVNNTPRLHGMLPSMSLAIERQYRELGHDRALELALEGEALTIERAQALAEALRAE